MSIHAEKLADAAELLAEMGTPVVIGGVEVNAIVSPIQTNASQLGQGGFMEMYDFSVKVLRGALVSVPRITERLLVDGEEYIIARVQKSPISPFVVLTVAIP